MNIQFDAPNERSLTSFLQTIKAKGMQLANALYKFIAAKETEKEKRKNELDYFEYFYSGLSERKLK